MEGFAKEKIEAVLDHLLSVEAETYGSYFTQYSEEIRDNLKAAWHLFLEAPQGGFGHRSDIRPDRVSCESNRPSRTLSAAGLLRLRLHTLTGGTTSPACEGTHLKFKIRNLETVSIYKLDKVHDHHRSMPPLEADYKSCSGNSF